MATVKMARVKVFSGNVNDIARFVDNCEKAGLQGRKSDAVLNLTGKIQEEDLEALKKVPGVLKVDIQEWYLEPLP